MFKRCEQASAGAFGKVSCLLLDTVNSTLSEYCGKSVSSVYLPEGEFKTLEVRDAWFSLN